MALEALSSNELFNFIIYDTISATPYSSHDSSETGVLLESVMTPRNQDGILENSSFHQKRHSGRSDIVQRRQNLSVQGRKKRRRKPRVCKNKEEAETQRMTHIAVERNRRKQMNEHLVVLRSLMPESYAQRGDQASIVGGAIEFVKELEHLVLSLEVQKFQLPQPAGAVEGGLNEDMTTPTPMFPMQQQPPFAQFFLYPHYTCSQIPNKYGSKTKASIADVEVTLIETHASLRILSRRSPRQLSKLVAGFQTIYLSILHLNVTAMDPLVLYYISAKVEEGCRLTSVDDIAGAVHHMLVIIEDEAHHALC